MVLSVAIQVSFYFIFISYVSQFPTMTYLIYFYFKISHLGHLKAFWVLRLNSVLLEETLRSLPTQAAKPSWFAWDRPDFKTERFTS